MIATVVCGRTDDQPFGGRNTFPLLGRPLMVYPLLAACHSAESDATFLSTDDAGLKRLGQHHGVEIIDRPADLSRPDVGLGRVVAHAYEEVCLRSFGSLEALVVLLANAPTVTSGQIDQAVRTLRSDTSLDAVTSVSPHNEFHPAVALHLQGDGRVVPYAASSERTTGRDVYFPDALLWVLRPSSFFEGPQKALHSKWIVDPAVHRVGGLVHEGYGDIDYAWQIPAVEEWLRRRGFDETRTPYPSRPAAVATPAAAPARQAVRRPESTIERRVLITTVPFGQVNRRSVELLQDAGIEYVINPIGRRLTEPELIEMAPEFGVLIAGTEPITRRVMDAAPHLRLISRVGVGLDNVDLACARERGIHVSYTPEAPAPAVAELTIGLMLALLRNTPAADRNLRSGVWNRYMGHRLSERTVGVVGVGRIGKRVIRHLTGGFPDIRILANDLTPDFEFGRSHGVRWVEKEVLYKEADVITVHLPLTPITRGLIRRPQIDLMKPTTVLVNTARGNMIDEADLALALREGRLAGAAVDVFEREPYSGELASLERCLLTCHMGSMSQDCRARMEIEATEEVVRFLGGDPLEALVPESEYSVAGIAR